MVAVPVSLKEFLLELSLNFAAPCGKKTTTMMMMQRCSQVGRREHIPKGNTADRINTVLSLVSIDLSGDVFVHVVAVGVDKGDGEVAGVVAV